MIRTTPKRNDLEAVTKWFVPALKGFSVIFGEFDDKKVTVIPDESETQESYLDGTADYWKTYAVQCYFAVADIPEGVFTEEDAENNQNVSAFEVATSINEWVSEQNRLKNFPQADPPTICERVEPVSVMPNFDGIEDGDTKLMRLTMFVKIYWHGVI